MVEELRQTQRSELLSLRDKQIQEVCISLHSSSLWILSQIAILGGEIGVDNRSVAHRGRSWSEKTPSLIRLDIYCMMYLLFFIISWLNWLKKKIRKFNIFSRNMHKLNKVCSLFISFLFLFLFYFCLLAFKSQLKQQLRDIRHHYK